MQNDINFVEYLTNLLRYKGLDDKTIKETIDDVRLNYAGEKVYICRVEKIPKEVIQREVARHGVRKAAKKLNRSRGFVYSYLK